MYFKLVYIYIYLSRHIQVNEQKTNQNLGEFGKQIRLNTNHI